jgi:hypothetical protein
VRSVRRCQVRSFEVVVAQVGGARGEPVVFGGVPAEADRRQRRLRGLLHRLGATPRTPATIPSDGADGPRALGEAACAGPTRHVLDCFHLAMRIRHVAQAAKGWPADTRASAKTARGWPTRSSGSAGASGTARCGAPSATSGRRWRGLRTGRKRRHPPLKVAALLRGLETYVSGQADLIIDYATARRDGEPISTASTEGTVQWLLHRRMGANQQMRWSPRGAHRMLQVRTALANGTLAEDHVAAEPWARRPFRPAA